MIIRNVFLLMSLIAAMFVGTAARAEWHKAESDHFVIFADDKEKDIRRFAENLERYHSAMSFLTMREVEKPSPSNRVTIFVVGSQADMRALSGSRRIGGFYIPRAGASRAFVQEIQNKNGYPHFSTVILLHEYAHHFLIYGSRFARPRWLQEGAAEFFAATTFNDDGSIMIGRPAQHRAYELAIPNPPSAEELLDADLFKRNRGSRDDGFYARSWLLYHYLTFSKERQGQLNTYWREIASGTSSRDAGIAAFGDLDALEKELKAYAREKKMFTYNLGPDKLSIGEVNIRKLSPGEAAVMPFVIVSQRGVGRDEAQKVVVDIRKVAAKYPEDAGVLAALAEAEFDAGNDDAAIAAADRAIAIDPARDNPYVQKGYALFRKAAAAEEKDAKSAYEAAMSPFNRLNALENDHPLPLIYYYRSFTERGIEPPENARHALERAAQLAPFDQALWFQVAMMQAQEGKIELAKVSLQPLAANPHGGSGPEAAKKLIELLDKSPEGVALAIQMKGLGDDDADEDASEDGEGGGDEEADPPVAEPD